MSFMPTSGPGSQGPEVTTDWKDPFSYLLENSNLVLNALGVTPPGYRLPGTVGNGYQLPGRLPNTFDQGYEVAGGAFPFLKDFLGRKRPGVFNNVSPMESGSYTPIERNPRYIPFPLQPNPGGRLNPFSPVRPVYRNEMYNEADYISPGTTVMPSFENEGGYPLVRPDALGTTFPGNRRGYI